MSLEQQIKDRARQLGFDAVGITDASAIDPANIERFQRWLASGCAGQMQYMYRRLDKRFAPAALLDGAASIVVVALGYKPPQSLPETNGQTGPFGRVAQYACYDDYHVVIKSLLYELASDIRSWVQEPVRFKLCVDSAPLAERALAVRAGLGFIGLNHMLIHPTLGPQVFLGELVTTTRLQTNQDLTGGSLKRSLGMAERDVPSAIPKSFGREAATHDCSSCRRCIQACPTGALQDDGPFDARKCISYLTMEHKGDIDPELSRKMGNHLFGCDECTLACPFQETAPPLRQAESPALSEAERGRLCTSPALSYHPDRASLDLQEVLAMDQNSFASRFANSPLLRPGLAALQRNAGICLQNGSRGTR